MTNEFRLLGPPGTGKTSWIVRQLEHASKKYDPSEIYLCSFSRAAAAEIVARAPDECVEQGNIGTIHALCYRHLHKPRLAEVNLLDLWLSECPQWPIKRQSLDDAADQPDVDGATLLMEYNRLRGCQPRTKRGVNPVFHNRNLISSRTYRALAPTLQAFIKKWESFKEDHQAADFTDLLLYGPTELLGAQVLMVDECLHGDSLVSCADGRHLPIRTIVEKRLKINVLSFDEKCGKIVSRRVTGWHTNQRRGRKVLRIGNLRATEDHKILTRQHGWIPLKRCLDLGYVDVVMPNASWIPHQTYTENQPAQSSDGAVYCLSVEGTQNFFADNICVSNCQDLNPLQWSLVRQWGEKCQVFCTAGDCDQMLYRFLGANPDEMMTPLANDRVKVLNQSYRIPRAVHGVASRWIGRLGTRRTHTDYKPTPEPGEVVRLDLSLREPENLARQLCKDSQDGSVMVLATCGYMLRGLIECLKDRGVPFHNPYARRRGDWNPLGRGVLARQVASFAHAHEAMRENAWDNKVLKNKNTWEWINLVRSHGNFQRGFKKRLADMPPRGDYLSALTEMAVTDEAIFAVKEFNLKWLRNNLTAEAKRRASYALQILDTHGTETLESVPKIILGTIHSVKGGEADTVYILPDLSMASTLQVEDHGQPAEDDITRMAYVGMTRTKRKLVLCEPSVARYFEV